MSARHSIVVMGVSGSGKSTIGELLGVALGCSFVDSDSLHPESNREKLSKGIPLQDDDRWPWLEALRACIKEAETTGRSIVIACSALKESYRRLLGQGTSVKFVYLQGSFETIHNRVSQRKGHFMNPNLLQSQFDTLEPPNEAIAVDVSLTPEQMMKQIMDTLQD